MTGLDILESKLQESITLRKDAISAGHVGSWEEYKFLSGIVVGLSAALDAVQELKERIEEM